MKTKLIKPSEHEIQQALIDYLRLRGWYVMRLNSGKYSTGEGSHKRFVVGQDAGTPDLMAFKEWYPEGAPNKSEVLLYFIEVKRKGNHPTDLQEAKMEELERYGAICIVATSIEDLKNQGL